jgi:hypothetical protein
MSDFLVLLFGAVVEDMTRVYIRWQAFFPALIHLIIGFLGLIIKAFASDDQTESWA